MASRCLEVPEMISHICEEILAISTSDLLQFALTAKPFLDPALNSLWRTQTGVVPLLKCLPADSWRVEGKTRGFFARTETLVFTRHLQPDDWQRAQFYTRRVKIFQYLDQTPKVQPSIFAEIAVSLPPSAQFLLPELKELSCPDDDAFFTHIRLLLPPSLTTLKLSICQAESYGLRTGTLLALPPLCPNLRNITIDGYVSGGTPPMGRILSRLPSIRHLKIQPIASQDARPLLASLPLLTSIDVTLEPHRPISHWGEHGILPHVTSLKIRDCLLFNVSDIMNSIESPHLHTIEIRPLALGGSKEGWIRFIQGLALRGSALRKVWVIEHLPPAFEGDYCMDPEILQHMFMLSNLTTIYIASNVPTNITDEFLQTLASKCQHLEDFCIVTQDGRHPLAQSLVTLKGLQSLTRLCPALYKIGLNVDTTVPFKFTSGQPIPCNKAVRNIWVGHSPINDSVRVAIALGTMFPNLSQIFTMTSLAASCCIPEWEKVVDHLNVVRALRTQTN